MDRSEIIRNTYLLSSYGDAIESLVALPKGPRSCFTEHSIGQRHIDNSKPSRESIEKGYASRKDFGEAQGKV